MNSSINLAQKQHRDWVPINMNGCVLYLPFWRYGANAQKIWDQSGQQNHGTITGAAPASNSVYTVETFLLKWGSYGTGNLQFELTYGVAVSASNIFVSSHDDHTVKIFDLSGNWVSTFGGPGATDGLFNHPLQLKVYGSELFVVDELNHRIQVFNLSGVYQRKWGSEGTGNDNYSSPFGICVYNNEVYVADTSNDRIKVTDLNGVYSRKWGSIGTGNGYFNHPLGLFVYNSEIYVTDQGNNRIQVFDLSGNYVRQFGMLGVGDGQFYFPYDVMVTSGDVYVADYGNNRIQVLDVNGVYKRKWGQFGWNVLCDGDFYNPSGFALSGTTLFIADSHNSRVQAFSLSYTNYSSAPLVGWQFNGSLFITSGSSIITPSIDLGDAKTILAWIYPLDTSLADQAIWGNYPGSGLQMDGPVLWFWPNTGGSQVTQDVGIVPLSWNLVGIYWTHSTTSGGFIRNGTLYPVSHSGANPGSFQMYIGELYAGNPRWAHMAMGEILIFNRVLSEVEISTYYSNTRKIYGM